jgi:hypothetical protein
MIVIDQCVSPFLADEIEKIFLDQYTTWWYDPTTSGNKFSNTEFNKFCETFQFVHPIMDNGRHDSVYTPVVLNLLDNIFVNYKFKILNYRRIKVNQLTKMLSKKNISHPPHVDDLADNMISLIYYINDADGPTYFYNNNYKCINQVLPKKNRCVLFSSNMLHASSSPILTDRRLVINAVASTDTQLAEVLTSLN